MGLVGLLLMLCALAAISVAYKVLVEWVGGLAAYIIIPVIGVAVLIMLNGQS